MTIDNLMKWSITVIDWCCMCIGSGETFDHLPLHCSIAKELWARVQWVMSKSVLDTLVCWQGKFGRHRNIEIWKAVPQYLMWCLW